jgi:protein TonB
MQNMTGKAVPNYQLTSELAKFCLPSAHRDPNRKLAWVNSICLLFLLIGVLGARTPVNAIRPVKPLEEPVPVILEPVTPPPPATVEQQKQERTDEEKPDTPQVVVVTPESPAINFPVPTIGNLLVPNAIAKAPPITPMKQVEPLRSQPTILENTGAGGDRPKPEYPKLAIAQGEEGTVVLSITVDDAGHITTISVKESSGYSLLDRAALDFVKKHWIIPPAGGARNYEAPIRFQLTRNN